MHAEQNLFSGRDCFEGLVGYIFINVSILIIIILIKWGKEECI
jgi:hypothetical protein